jgi:uncharacterized protein (TIGR03435 family)
MKTSLPTISLSLLAGSLCFAQAPGPAFEVASIRMTTGPRSPACERRTECVEISPGLLAIRGESLRFLIRWAYDLPPVQVDAPDGLAETRFELVAKTAGPVSETQLRQMLQTLLADRFGLKTHTETRVMQSYVMTLAKSGPKFQESATEGSFVLERASPVVLNAHHARMIDLAHGIAGEIGRPVVDATNLTGRYEIHMDISPYIIRNGGATDGQIDMMSILFTGLRELLGLQLESRKESVDILVVDHVEKSPTDN